MNWTFGIWRNYLQTRDYDFGQADECEQLRALLKSYSSADFDGHTDFAQLSPSQRLDALASLAIFIKECKGKAAKTKDNMQ